MGNRWHVCSLDSMSFEGIFDTKEKAMQQVDVAKKCQFKNLVLFKEAGRVSAVAADNSRKTFESDSAFIEYMKQLEGHYGTLQTRNINPSVTIPVGDVINEVWTRDGNKVVSVIKNEVTCLKDLSLTLSKYIKPELLRTDLIKVYRLHEITVPLALGLSSIKIDTVSGVWHFEIVHSNGEVIIYSKDVVNTQDSRARTDVDALLKKVNYTIEYYSRKFPYESHLKLDKIAGWISGLTGTKYDFAGEDNGSLTLDFNVGISYLKNKEGKGLYFALNTNTGKEIATVDLNDCNGDVNTFVTRVVQVINNRDAQLMKR